MDMHIHEPRHQHFPLGVDHRILRLDLRQQPDGCDLPVRHPDAAFHVEPVCRADDPGVCKHIGFHFFPLSGHSKITTLSSPSVSFISTRTFSSREVGRFFPT